MYTQVIEYENLGKVNKRFYEDYQSAFTSFMEGGWYILGKSVNLFEKSFSNYCNIKHCIGVANGLDALIISLQALGLEKGSEVIVPSNTYIATILAIVHCQFKPVLVEPNIETYNIDPSKIEEKITGNTKAILLVHLYGKVCEMDSILAIAKKYDLFVVEDCAQAHGAKFKDQMAGTFGQMAGFSFYPTKNLGALGDAGAILTNDSYYDGKVRMMRNYGSEKKYYNSIVGYNSRLDEVQSAFLSIKLKYLDDINNHKRKLAQLYFDNLKCDFIKPFQSSDNFDVHHIYPIRHERRNQLKEYLQTKGIMTEIHYPVPPNRQKAMIGIIDKEETPIAEEIHDTILSLPISYYHTESDVLRVVEALNSF
jgi:dTDP-4-amino-4,6-dideoxygalactose transaminase